MIRTGKVQHIADRASQHHDHDRLRIVDDATHERASEDGTRCVRGHGSQVDRVD